MHTRYLVLLLFLSFFHIQLFGQELFTLNGTITDASSNETLIGVNIIFPEASTGVVTNEYGYYSIKLPQGTYQVQITYLGYQSILKTIDINSDQKLNFQLEEASESLEEVLITSDVEGLNIRKPEMSVNKLSIKTIQNLPVVFGEVDVVRSLLLLPGVSNAGEGSSGFNVRGGAVDQNLILFHDEAGHFRKNSPAFTYSSAFFRRIYKRAYIQRNFLSL